MKLIESIMTNNPCYTAGRKITVKGLMLHSVGCPQPSASVFLKSWNKASFKTACVHAFIDGNTGDVYQTLPWNHRGWHGGGSSNNTHIGVEMCEPATIKYTGGSSWKETGDGTNTKATALRTYKAAVELFAEPDHQPGDQTAAEDGDGDGQKMLHRQIYRCGHREPVGEIDQKVALFFCIHGVRQRQLYKGGHGHSALSF